MNDFLKQAESLRKKRKVAEIFNYAFIALVAISLIAVIVFILLLGLGKGDNEKRYLILIGALLGGVILFGVLAFFGMKCVRELERKERDFSERADSEESFLVGEGTFATFTENALKIHGVTREKKQKSVEVPYSEMRFIAVCSRRAPKEKGEWSVVFEIPSKYLSGKKDKAELALVQTEYKERLLECIDRYGLTLLGEKRQDAKKKFEKLETFTLPDPASRKRALITTLAGVGLTGAGVGLAFWNTLIGAIAGVFGFYIALKGFLAFLNAKATLAVYEEGIYWADAAHSDSAFVKWEEIDRITRGEKEGAKIFRAECVYGAYEYPDIAGAYEYIKERFPEKCGE